MYFTFKDCRDKNGKSFKHILHIGAHHGEEIEEYSNCGVESVCWFEANPSCITHLKERTEPYSHIEQEYFCEALSDANDQKISFNVTSNGQSSSILELGTHLQYYPNIQVVEKITLSTKRIDSLESIIDFNKFDFLTIDVQGAELKVLKGFGEIFNRFPNIKGIYTEINFEQVYIGAAQFDELTEYLKSFGFKVNRYFRFDSHPWGDAFFLRE